MTARRILVLLCLGSCALPSAGANVPVRLAYGTVVEVHPVKLTPESSEYVVREDDGAVLTVVQQSIPPLVPGERVSISFDPRPAIARSVPGS